MPEQYFHPDKIIIFTLSNEERQKRILAEGKRTQEFFKSQENIFAQKINDSYLKVAKEFNIPTLDTSNTPDKVFENLKKIWDI